ncbi:MAG: carbohydrate binding family 9 domain-containing protein [Gemmatimonadaceae bacterium]|nr:carbohydrate binding family 9 domain-containing protein [Gemmatimonadaceae bacterium]
MVESFRLHLLLAACIAFAPLGTAAQVADTLPRPTLRAAFRSGDIRIDGRLDEADWERAEAAKDFVQNSPNPGAPGTHPTEARVLYDRAALYIGVRMSDPRPDSIAQQMARRDAVDIYSDWIRIGIDSYFDRRTSFIFAVSPRGIQRDEFRYNDNENDPLWDAVWESAAHIDSAGWSVEVRIPLSQLRFSVSNGATARWGIQFGRMFARNNEADLWSPMPPQQPGVVSRYGDLVGLDSLVSPRRLEVLPYVSSQVERAPGNRANPFYQATAADVRVGADVRYGLPAGLTLTATVTPDFGQVEVDPAVVNLSAFEVFFPERRPFFLEGVDIFRFGQSVTFNDNNPSNFFYTRRVGRAPRRSLATTGAAYSDVPSRSDIVAAAKVSGKTAGGLSVGALGALTREVQGRFTLPSGGIGKAPVEPRTGFLVTRLRQDFRQGNTVIGGVATAVRRSLDDPALASFFVRDAVVSGADFEHRWGRRTWALSGFLAGSRVAADAPVITALQRSPIRSFQRPDSRALRLDTTKTSLDGIFGTLSLARTAGEHWLGSLTYEHTSPGFEVNDLGFQTRADIRSLSSAVQFRETRPGAVFRNYQMQAFVTGAANADGNVVEKRLSVLANGLLNSFWGLNTWLFIQPEAWDDRLLRGGPLSRKPTEYQARVGTETDNRRVVVGSAAYEYNGNAAREWRHTVEAGVEIRPSSAARIQFRPQLVRQFDVDQYVTVVRDPASATYGSRWVFGDIDQSEFSLETRAEWTFSPMLTLQLWAQPFVASGRYRSFKEFRTPGRFDFDVYGRDRGTITRHTGANGDQVRVDPDGSGLAPAFSFGEQDFLVRSLRGNAVLRWEYRPGSTLFVVWQQQREGFRDVADLAASRDLSSAFRDPARNVFLVKVSYWLGR